MGFTKLCRDSSGWEMFRPIVWLLELLMPRFASGYFFPLFISELAEGAPIPPAWCLMAWICHVKRQEPWLSWPKVGELVLANLVAFPAFYLSTQALWKVECLEEATCVQHKIDEVLNLDVGYKKAGSNFVAVVACWFWGFLSSGRTLEQRKWSLPQQNTPWMSELAAGKILARFWWASPWWRFVHVFAWCKLEYLGKVWFAVDGCRWAWTSTNFQCRYKAAKTEVT